MEQLETNPQNHGLNIQGFSKVQDNMHTDQKGHTDRRTAQHSAYSGRPRETLIW